MKMANEDSSLLDFEQIVADFMGRRIHLASTTRYQYYVRLCLLMYYLDVEDFSNTWFSFAFSLVFVRIILARGQSVFSFRVHRDAL